jgi:alkylation response protein AidB-like acyl-CoA dehydrogenase
MGYPKTDRQAAILALADEAAALIGPRAEAHDRANAFPFDDIADLHRLGYLALTVPAEYGGRGADPLEVALAQERLGRASGPTALMVTMHLALLGRLAANRVWPEPIFAEVCRSVVARGALVNTINSEPGMGSPSRGGMPATTLTRQPDGGWLLEGRKSWGSLAPGLTWLSVLAAVVDGEAPPRRGNVLLPAGTPGLRIEETWDNLGMRATASHDVVLEGVRLPPDTPILADSSSAPAKVGGWALLGPAVFLGIAQAARDEAVAWARRRQPNGMDSPIAALQTVQHKAAQMEILLWQARAALFGTAEKWVAEPEARSGMDWELAAAKLTVSNHAVAVTDLALRTVGAASLSRALPLERFFRDARAGLFQPPMEDAALTLIGKRALGVDDRPGADGRPTALPGAETAAASRA